MKLLKYHYVPTFVVTYESCEGDERRKVLNFHMESYRFQDFSDRYSLVSERLEKGSMDGDVYAFIKDLVLQTLINEVSEVKEALHVFLECLFYDKNKRLGFVRAMMYQPEEDK